MTKLKETCGCCGHVKVAYVHNLNTALCDALVRLAICVSKTKKGVNLQKDLVLTKNQYNNFQKLQYFGLVHRIPSGWMITSVGAGFVNGETKIYDHVATFGKEILSHDHKIREGDNRRKFVTIREVLGTGYKKREEYQEEKRCPYALFDNDLHSTTA